MELFRDWCSVRQKRPVILPASGQGGKGSFEQGTDGYVAGKEEESMDKIGSRKRRKTRG